jgi:hypothetical protein
MNMLRFAKLFLFAALSVALVSPVSGQVPWDTPLLVGPGSPGGISFFLADPGEGLGAFAQWQGGGGRSQVGFRAGIAEDHADDLAVFGGVDFNGSVFRHTEDFPLDVIWVAGAGVSLGNDAILSFPVGISLGREVTDDEVWFHPYLAPHLVVDAYLGDAEPHSHGEGEAHVHDHDDMNMGFVLDLGADVSFSGSWVFRFGASVGEREGLAIGFRIPT